jgi:hypothetical protein
VPRAYQHLPKGPSHAPACAARLPAQPSSPLEPNATPSLFARCTLSHRLPPAVPSPHALASPRPDERSRSRLLRRHLPTPCLARRLLALPDAAPRPRQMHPCFGATCRHRRAPELPRQYAAPHPHPPPAHSGLPKICPPPTPPAVRAPLPLNPSCRSALSQWIMTSVKKPVPGSRVAVRRWPDSVSAATRGHRPGAGAPLPLAAPGPSCHIARRAPSSTPAPSNQEPAAPFRRARLHWLLAARPPVTERPEGPLSWPSHAHASPHPTPHTHTCSHIAPACSCAGP